AARDHARSRLEPVSNPLHRQDTASRRRIAAAGLAKASSLSCARRRRPTPRSGALTAQIGSETGSEPPRGAPADWPAPADGSFLAAAAGAAPRRTGPAARPRGRLARRAGRLARRAGGLARAGARGTRGRLARPGRRALGGGRRRARPGRRARGGRLARRRPLRRGLLKLLVVAQHRAIEAAQVLPRIL